MDDTQRIVKCGNLALHTPGGFFKKRWHSKYLVLYDGSKSGVKRLELFESEIKFKKQNPVKIIPLVDCVRIVTCQRHKTTFTFEVRTSDQFYLLASKSFQEMNDWVNCLRLVAFGEQQSNGQQQSGGKSSPLNNVGRANQHPPQKLSSSANGEFNSSSSPSFSGSSSSQSTSPVISASTTAQKRLNGGASNDARPIDVLLDRQQQHAASSTNEPNNRQHQQVSALSNGGLVSATSRLATSGLSTTTNRQMEPDASGQEQKSHLLTASQAAAAAASALAKTRQRQPSLLGSCKPQPPDDSPFIQQQRMQIDERFQVSVGQHEQQSSVVDSSFCAATSGAAGQMDTLTPTVRGQLIAAATTLANQNISSKPFMVPSMSSSTARLQPGGRPLAMTAGSRPVQIGSTLDEEEENMLYCSIEDNPSEHNYRVKVIETELALRCQLKCYQLTASTTISQQYEELAQFRLSSSATYATSLTNNNNNQQQPALVTFYQLIIGPQELTLLNDYATSYSQPTRTLNHQQANSKLQNQQGLWSWPYQCIRRYGFDKDNCFMFEAGRKCTSGPGQFIVQTPKAYNIYQDVVKFVNELRTISTACQPTAMTQAQTNDSMEQQRQQQQMQFQQQQQHQSKQLIVTQIPVTWTPNQNGTTVNDSIGIANHNRPSEVSNRRQFFDSLPQLDRPTTTATARLSTEDEPLGGGTNRHSNGNDGKDEPLTNRQDVSHNSQAKESSDALRMPNSIDGHQIERPTITSGHHPIGKSTSHDFASTQMAPNGTTVTSAQVDSSNGQQSQQQQQQSQTQQRQQVTPSDMTKRYTLTSSPTSATATANSNSQQRQQLASISSSASDETDESGYEQGDESVDSGPVVRQQNSRTGFGPKQSAINGAGGWRSGSKMAVAASRQAGSDHSSAMSSSASSSSTSSSSSSASNSPGQSISRRTADQIGHSVTQSTANGSEQVKATANQSSNRPRLPLLNELTKSSSALPSVTNDTNPFKGSNQRAQQANSIRSTSGLHNLLTASCLLASDDAEPKDNRAKSASNIRTLDDDFETSLIRDVYSEITKLHAKFAVTTNGADDSMSSGGESVVASSSSDNNPGMNGDEDEVGHPDDYYDSMEGGENYTAEPMYSNLKPVVDMPRRIVSCNEGHRVNNNDSLHSNFPRCAAKQQQFQTGNNQPVHFNEHIRPPPLYPSILNPIPEIAEHQPTRQPTYRARDDDRNVIATSDSARSKLASLRANNNNNNDSNGSINHDTHHHSQQLAKSDLDRTRDGLPRARLALNREVIKRCHQSVGQQQQLNSPTPISTKKPTNHYLINDVQYAKISRNMAATGGRTHPSQEQLTNGQRRR